MAQNLSFKQPKPMLQTTSLWDFPSQHYGNKLQGDQDYAGVTPSYIIWNLLQRYTKPGDTVLDPMCGSGTTLDVCADLKRSGVGFDLQPQRAGITKGDARSVPVKNGTVDFVFMDPPYSTHIEYSDDSRCIGSLTAQDPAYYEAMEEVIAEMYRVLKDGAYLGLYVSDSSAKGKPFCPIGFELFLRLSKLFQPVDIVAVTRHNKTLKRNHWHTAGIEGNYMLRGFNYLFVLRKNVMQDEQLLRHEDASYLSPYFQQASKLGAEQLMTPDRFSEVLMSEQSRLENERLAEVKADQEKKAKIKAWKQKDQNMVASQWSHNRPQDRSAGRRDVHSEKRSYDRNKPRGEWQDRRSFSGDRNKPRGEWQDRRSFSSDGNKPRGEWQDRRSFSGDRNKPRGEWQDRRSFSGDRNKPHGEWQDRRSFSGDRNKPRGERQDRRSFSGDRNKPRGERQDRRSFSGDRNKPRGEWQDRRSFSSDGNKPRGEWQERGTFSHGRKSMQKKNSRKFSSERHFN